MGFWVFMLVFDLLQPVTMLCFGRRFLKKPPREISAVFGYRTARSMKNRDTWQFAHRYVGRLWWISGLVTLPLSAGALLLVLGRSVDVIGAMGAVICGVQLLPLVGVIIPTERALKRTFDQYGRRR